MNMTYIKLEKKELTCLE